MGNEGDHLIDKIGDTDSGIYKSMAGERNINNSDKENTAKQDAGD